MKTRQIEEEEREKVSKALSKRLEAHDEIRKTVQEELHKICEEFRENIEGLEGKVGSELEEKFTAEESRLQSAYEDLQMDGGDTREALKKIQEAKGKLFVIQSYDIVGHDLCEEGPMRKIRKIGEGGSEEAFDLSSLYELKIERQPVLEMVDLMKPTNLRVSETTKGAISLQFTCLGPDELKALFEDGYENQIKFKCLLTNRGKNESREYALRSAAGGRFKFTSRTLAKKSTYGVRVKMTFGDKESEWSDEATIPGGIRAEGPGPSVSGLNPERLEEEREDIKRMLNERIEIHDESRKVAQEKLHEICEELRAQVENLYERINSELEEKFTKEDNRLQTALDELRSSKDEEISKMIQKAKTELLTEQSYDVTERNLYEDEDDMDLSISSLYELKTERKASFEVLGERKPTNVILSFTERGELSLSFSFFNEDEVKVLKRIDSPFEVEAMIWEKGHEEETSKTLTKELTLGTDEPICFRSTLTASTTYCLKMKIVHQEVSTQWSDEAEFKPGFKDLCVWKDCPYYVDKDRKYSVDEKNPRIATKIGNGGNYCTIIGNTLIPPNKVTSWSVKVLKSRNDDGSGINIGVAPFDINQNKEDNYKKCGWYYYCYDSTLRSGPPHNHSGKKYGPEKGGWGGEYVYTGDSVGVVMDTTKGDLSFVLNEVNLGVAYEEIPLDKPLVPCVLLWYSDDSIGFSTFEVKENMDGFIPVPSNITAKSTTWDTITLTWDAVKGASFYQIEVDGSKSWYAFTTNLIRFINFLPDTEHTFRVRSVRRNSVSEWSDVVKAKTEKAFFETGGWKECPDDAYEDRRGYSIDAENPRIATKIGDEGYCTIIGNTPLPLNQVTLWCIKVLKSRDNSGGGINVGVAPFDIDQNEGWKYDKCGWYFYCWFSTLISGPPHNYRSKEYGPRKEDRKYIHTGDNIGVVMDTTNGELSFILDGVDLGVAYEGIPLDKPLVPCVLLWYSGDSVELII